MCVGAVWAGTGVCRTPQHCCNLQPRRLREYCLSIRGAWAGGRWSLEKAGSAVAKMSGH